MPFWSRTNDKLKPFKVRDVEKLRQVGIAACSLNELLKKTAFKFGVLRYFYYRPLAVLIKPIVLFTPNFSVFFWSSRHNFISISIGTVLL